MVIDKGQYKELMKDGGGKFRAIAYATVITEYASTDIKIGSSLNLYVMENGLLGDIALGKKFYIEFGSLRDITMEDNKIILEVEEVEDSLNTYVFKSAIPLQLKKLYMSLRQYAGFEYKEPIKSERFLEKLKKEMENNIQTEEKRAVMSKRQIEKERLAELKANKIPFCPKCHSTSLHYIEKRKRFSLGRTIVGGAVGSLVNPIGTAVGAAMGGLTSNKQKKGEVKCLNCGYKWKL